MIATAILIANTADTAVAEAELALVAVLARGAGVEAVPALAAGADEAVGTVGALLLARSVKRPRFTRALVALVNAADDFLVARVAAADHRLADLVLGRADDPMLAVRMVLALLVQIAKLALAV